MSAEFGAPVDVFISPVSNVEGDTIVNIPLGAVFKYLRDSSEWSKEDFVGPVIAAKPVDANDYLDIQLFNRRSIYNIRIKFYKNSGYHRTDNIIMMKATDGTVYGLASNNDYVEQLNMLQDKLKEFVETPLSPISCSSRITPPFSPSTDSALNQSFVSDVSSSILKPLYINDLSKPSNLYDEFFRQNTATPTFKQKTEKEEKFLTKPCMIPASVYRRAAAPKNNLSRPSSVTPTSMSYNEKILSFVNRNENNMNNQFPFKQGHIHSNGFPSIDNHQNIIIPQKSSLLTTATSTDVPSHKRMDAILELLSFSFSEGVKRGHKDSLAELSNDQLLNVLEDVFKKRPDIKTSFMEKFN